MKLAGVSVLIVLFAQATTPVPLERMARPAPLSEAEMESLAETVGELLVGKAFIRYGGFGGGTIKVGPGPRASAVFYGDRVDEWTGLPARTCAGAALEGELVVNWESTRSGWQPRPHASTDPRVFDPLFSLWDLPASALRDAGLRVFDGVETRGLRYPYARPEGARFEAEWQSLWLDPRTGLPVRYEIEVTAPEELEYGYYLAYAPGWTGGPDAATPRPDCVPTRR